MKYRFVMMIIAVLAAIPATAQIFRCEVDGVVAFSDLPCGPDSEAFTSGVGVSFVTPDENLPALAEAAQAFILQRRERLARRFRPEGQAAIPAPVRPATSEPVYLPWPVIGHTRPVKRSEGGAGPPPDITDKARYSPLAGPILGTRRDIWLFDHEFPRNEGERRQ